VDNHLLEIKIFVPIVDKKNTTKKLSIGDFISNLFSGFLSYDSRFWTTFIPLLTQPEKVSKDYIEGKQAGFVNPFQLYLNISIVFFLILGLTISLAENNNSINNTIEASKNLNSISQKETKQLDSILTNVKEEIVKTNQNDSTKTEVITSFGNFLKLNNSNTTEEYSYNITNDTLKNISLFNKINDFTTSMINFQITIMNKLWIVWATKKHFEIHFTIKKL